VLAPPILLSVFEGSVLTGSFFWGWVVAGLFDVAYDVYYCLESLSYFWGYYELGTLLFYCWGVGLVEVPGSVFTTLDGPVVLAALGFVSGTVLVVDFTVLLPAYYNVLESLLLNSLEFGLLGAFWSIVLFDAVLLLGVVLYAPAALFWGVVTGIAPVWFLLLFAIEF